MTISYFLKQFRRFAMLAAALWFASATARAQTAPATPAPQKMAPTAAAAPASFQSALDGYMPYTDEKTGNWKEANDLTARIGGWRAYAKEAAQPEANPRAGQEKPVQAKP